MDDKEMIIFIGIQASGKTTFYQERFAQYVHINLDILHTRNKERIALEERFALGKNMVIDNTNPTAVDRKRYIDRARENGQMIVEDWKEGIGVYFEDTVKEGYNPITKTAVQTTRRELTVDYDLILGREYGEWVAAFVNCG